MKVRQFSRRAAWDSSLMAVLDPAVLARGYRSATGQIRVRGGSTSIQALFQPRRAQRSSPRSQRRSRQSAPPLSSLETLFLTLSAPFSFFSRRTRNHPRTSLSTRWNASSTRSKTPRSVPFVPLTCNRILSSVQFAGALHRFSAKGQENRSTRLLQWYGIFFALRVELIES